MSRRPMRVLHLPARTPYAWKLHSHNFEIANGTRVPTGDTAPDAPSAQWLLEQASLDWFDVLHLHHVEFEEVTDLERLLDRCTTEGKGLVHTAHDLKAMFTTDAELHKRLRVLDQAAVSWVCLTAGSTNILDKILGHRVRARTIPHGYVVAPEHAERLERSSSTTARYLMYGASRPNRDQVATVLNWSLRNKTRDGLLHLVMRGISPAHLTQEQSPAYRLAQVVRADPRVRVTMRGYPSDSDINEAAAGSDALILPYLWATHSGQLELAFDLGLLPVTSNVGHLADQHSVHADLVDEPVWFDWSSGNPYLFGERFVAALEVAEERLNDQPRRISPEFTDYRRSEHRDLLEAYTAVYEGSR